MKCAGSALLGMMCVAVVLEQTCLRSAETLVVPPCLQGLPRSIRCILRRKDWRCSHDAASSQQCSQICIGDWHSGAPGVPNPPCSFPRLSTPLVIPRPQWKSGGQYDSSVTRTSLKGQ